MEEGLFISLCIPAYRRTEFLQRLLDSIEAQSYRHFEVVLTDDSPGREVQELVDRHPLKSKIRYFKNAVTLGTPENWNESVRKAQYEWIKIMHDDDWFSGPESLKAFANAVKFGNSRFYFAAFANHYPDGRTQKVAISTGHLEALKKNPGVLLAANRIGPPSVVLFRKDATLEFDRRMQWLVDIDFYIAYLRKYPGVGFISESLVNIGISDSQVTHSSFGNRNIEIRERFLLGEKLPPQSMRNLVVFDSWWRFIRNMQIRELHDIAENGYTGEIPATIQSLITYQSRISPALLRWGIGSKLLMFQQYLRSRNGY